MRQNYDWVLIRSVSKNTHDLRLYAEIICSEKENIYVLHKAKK